MRKKTKITIIAGAVAACFLITGIIAGWSFITMRPAKTGHIDGTKISAVKNIMNSLYLISSLDGYILVDAGTNAKAAEKAIRKLHINPDDVKYILLTHSDYDHVASLPVFRNAKIYMGEDELQMINGTTRRNKSSYNSLPEGIRQESITLLKDGEILNLLNHQILCMKAPGHTTGSMMFLLDGMYLFTGDALRVSGKKLGVHPFSMDEDMALKTIQIKEEIITGSNLVLTAHYGYYPGEELSLNLKGK